MTEGECFVRPTFGVAFLSAVPISQAPWTNVWQGLILFGPIWLSGIMQYCFISPPRPYLLFSYSGTLIPLLDASHALDTDHICLFFLHKRPFSTFLAFVQDETSHYLSNQCPIVSVRFFCICPSDLLLITAPVAAPLRHSSERRKRQRRP